MFRHRAMLGAVVIMGFIAAGCGTAATQGPSTSTVSKSAASQTNAYQGATLTDATWEPVVANPQSYIGAPVVLTGKLNEIIPNTSPALGQVFLDPSNLSEPIAASGLTSVPVNSYVRLQGTLTQVENFQNAFGASSGVPVVTSTRVQIISRDAAEDPTLAVAPTIASQNQNGLTLAVSKVEFAAHATRVFLTATNDTSSGVMIDDVDATLVQGTTQLASHSISPDMNYFPTTIANGVISHDELVFDAAQLQGGSLTLTVSASSDNFNQNWNNFVFKIPMPNSSSTPASSAIPTAATTSIPFSVEGTPGAGNTLTIIWPTLPSGWSFVQVSLYNLTYPNNDTFDYSYFSKNSNGYPSFAIPMALQGTHAQFVVQFQNVSGQTLTEKGPVFKIP
ncbi:MAG: hypothetical protein ACYCOU_02230 [Sulfobacillus sp.]